MKEIEWRHEAVYGSVRAQVGNVSLKCILHSNTKHEWRGSISIGHGGIFGNTHRRFGKWRKSLSRAKEDAIQLAREMLEDYKVCIDRDMNNFGLRG